MSLHHHNSWQPLQMSKNYVSNLEETKNCGVSPSSALQHDGYVSREHTENHTAYYIKFNSDFSETKQKNSEIISRVLRCLTPVKLESLGILVFNLLDHYMMYLIDHRLKD